MAVLITDQNDNVIGKCEYRQAKNQGKILRSSNILVFDSGFDNILLAQRPLDEKSVSAVESAGRLHVGAGKWQSSAAGYVDGDDVDPAYLETITLDQTLVEQRPESYMKAALRELREELFSGELPLEIRLIPLELGIYINTRGNNPQHIGIFGTVYEGPFNPNPNEVAKIEFEPFLDVINPILDEMINYRDYPSHVTRTFSHICVTFYQGGLKNYISKLEREFS